MSTARRMMAAILAAPALHSPQTPLHQIAAKDALRWHKVPIPEPPPGHVLIRVQATAVNRADILQRKGLYPPPKGITSVLGLECAGVVEKVAVPDPDSTHPAVTAVWKKGDRVMALLRGGGYAEYAVAHSSCCLPIPNHMDMETAAAIPEAFLTAFQLVDHLAHLRPKESIWVHAGASSVGLAAIQYSANIVGANVISTAGSDVKGKACRLLGATHVFNYKVEKNLTENIIEATGGAGVDVILDCVGASMFEKNLECLGMDGRWILYGSLGGVRTSGPVNLAPLLAKRIQLVSTTLRNRSTSYQSELVRHFRERVWTYLNQERLLPVVYKKLPITKAAQGHNILEADENIGKVVLSFNGSPHEMDA